MSEMIPKKYPIPMRILHWLMALILLCTLVMGLYMASFPLNPPTNLTFITGTGHSEYWLLFW
ncbi:hypothetical protein F0265_22950 [Vibrio sp. RE88]|nr:hypothetical protein [Vibrio sp. RE88]